MSVGNVGYPGTPSGGASQASPYGTPARPAAPPSLAATLSNAPAPRATLTASGTFAAPPLSTVTSSGLIKAPEGPPPGYAFATESSPSGLMGSTGTGQGRHTASKVFWATIAVYTTFLAGVAGILTLPALGKFRGRAPRFTTGNKEHVAYVKEQKQKLFDSEYTAFKRAGSKTALERDGAFNAAPGAGAEAGRDTAHGGPRVVYPQLTPEQVIERFVSTDPEKIEHNGWWQRTDETIGVKPDAASAGMLIGFHKQGAAPGTSAGAVSHGMGELRVAYDPQNPRHAALVKSLKLQHMHVPDARDSAAEHLVTIDPALGRRVHHVARINLPPTEGARKALLETLGVAPSALKKRLVELKRIDPNKELFQASSFERQFERRQGAPFVDAGDAKRRTGQVAQRLQEYWEGAKSAWENAREGGNGVGRMLLSSTMLNALLAATAATVALAWTTAPDPKHPEDASD